MAVAGALALGACGTQRADSSRTDVRADAASQPSASAAGGSKQELLDAFTIPEALLKVEKDCGGGKELEEYLKALEALKDLPEDEGALPADLPADPGTDKQPPSSPVPLPEDLGESPNPEDFGLQQKGDPEQWEKDMEKREKCVTDAHTERVTNALKGRTGLTPKAVADTLRDLGYPAMRLVGPKESAGAVQFTLDLSFPFGPQCLSMATANGKVAAVPHQDYLAGEGIAESEERCEQRKVVP